MEKQHFFSNKALFRLILPLMIEQFLAIAIGLIDTVMVSSLGEQVVSGVSLVDSINILLIQIFSALATGGAVIASQYIGKREHHNAIRSAKQLLYVSVAISMLFAVLSLVFCDFILTTVFGTVELKVMEAAHTYFLISAISYPFLAIFNSCAALYRSVGNSKISMFIAIIMNVLNVIGNAVGIYALNLNVAGAALATLLSRIVGALIILILITRRGQKIYIDSIFHFEFDGSMIKRILKIGIPSGFENGAFQIGKILIASLVTTFGTAAIAANSIAGHIASISNIPGGAIGLAMITVVGQCIGADDHEQAKYYTKKLMILTFITMNIFNVLIAVFANPLVACFNLSPEASSSAVDIIVSFAIMASVFWPIAFTLPNSLRAAGDVKFTMFSSVASMAIFRIGCSFIIGQMLSFGVLGTWYAMYIDWIIRAALFLGRYLSGNWKNKRAV